MHFRQLYFAVLGMIFFDLWRGPWPKHFIQVRFWRIGSQIYWPGNNEWPDFSHRCSSKASGSSLHWSGQRRDLEKVKMPERLLNRFSTNTTRASEACASIKKGPTPFGPVPVKFGFGTVLRWETGSINRSMVAKNGKIWV